MVNLPKGIHKVKKRLSNGSVETYYYAWRGGPRLLSKPHTDDFQIEYGAALQSRKSVDGETLYELVGQYLVSHRHKSLARGTRTYREKSCDLIRSQLGGLTIQAITDIGVKSVFMNWRDRFEKTPKAADMNMETLRVVLSYACERGKLSVNNAKGISGLYKNNRAEVIWTEAEIEVLREYATSACMNAVDFARWTGLRRGDCAAITWDADKGTHLDWQTSKTDRRVFVPIVQELRELLDRLPRTAETILTNTQGNPWRVQALSNAFTRAKNAANIDKRFHDLRGTFATMLLSRGLSDERMADIMAWSRYRVAEIRRVYVSKEAVIQDVLRQLDVNHDVNRKLKGE